AELVAHPVFGRMRERTKPPNALREQRCIVRQPVRAEQEDRDDSDDEELLEGQPEHEIRLTRVACADSGRAPSILVPTEWEAACRSESRSGSSRTSSSNRATSSWRPAATPSS